MLTGVTYSLREFASCGALLEHHDCSFGAILVEHFDSEDPRHTVCSVQYSQDWVLLDSADRAETITPITASVTGSDEVTTSVPTVTLVVSSVVLGENVV